MLANINKALVVGCARSGIATAKVLHSLGIKVLLNDLKSEENFIAVKDELKEYTNISFYFGCKPDKLLDDVDMVIISPGVPIDSGFVKAACEMGIEVISEIELAYRFCKSPIIGITGTNGKTTTTALVGEIFKAAGINTYVVGNIGIPFIEKAVLTKAEDIVVSEVSSFQLEAVKCFRPKVSAILNITEDHLNRHKTMDNYIKTKSRIYENLDDTDFIVLNGDDPYLSSSEISVPAQVYYFNRKSILDKGAYVRDNKIVLNIGGNEERICNTDDLQIPGLHNLENALAASLIAGLMGISSDVISDVLKSFKGMEHRLEMVDVINNITFYNDSKGTNPDSSIKAIEAMKTPTVLIAGGMDKDSDFSEFVDAFGDKIKALVVLGETAEKIADTAKSKGFINIHKVKGIEEAVEKAFRLADSGDSVLLSPACASWDMFKDYEERGRVFKEAVRGLRR